MKRKSKTQKIGWNTFTELQILGASPNCTEKYNQELISLEDIIIWGFLTSSQLIQIWSHKGNKGRLIREDKKTFLLTQKFKKYRSRAKRKQCRDKRF